MNMGVDSKQNRPVPIKPNQPRRRNMHASQSTTQFGSEMDDPGIAGNKATPDVFIY